MPVIWATQVLETLAKTGLPSRAEITDAAMGERAECVMLNKGPHIYRGDANSRRYPAPHAISSGEEKATVASATGLGHARGNEFLDSLASPVVLKTLRNMPAPPSGRTSSLDAHVTNTSYRCNKRRVESGSDGYHPEENDMLCMQQCIDMCELSDEQVLAVREHFDLQDILAIQGSCLSTVSDPLGVSECLLLGLQKRTANRDK